jgi:hypothetical protein
MHEYHKMFLILYIWILCTDTKTSNTHEKADGSETKLTRGQLQRQEKLEQCSHQQNLGVW